MATHRYWRIRIHHQQSPGGNSIGCAEIEMRESQGGSDVTGSGTASASHEWSGTLTAANAFDDNNSTEWAADNRVSPYTNNHWIKYDFGSGNDKDIVEITWKCRGSTTDSPLVLSLQYSDNDSDWTTKYIWINQANTWTAGETKTFNADSDNAFANVLSPLHMTSNTAPSPNVASASTEYSSSFRAWEALNVDLSYYWAANTDTGWLKIDLGSGNAVEATSVGWQNNSIPEPDRMPKDFTIQGSNNDSDWTTLKTVTGETSWGNSELRAFALTTTGSYRYYKVDITDNNGDSLVACAGFYLLEDIVADTYNVTYDGNGSDGGSVPTDANDYEESDTVTVLGNTGSLTKTGYNFAGWNTASDGSGTSYDASDTFSMPAANVTLYAEWALAISVTLGTMSVQSYAATIAAPTTIDCTKESVVVQKFAPYILIGTPTEVNCTLGTIALSGNNPDVFQGTTIETNIEQIAVAALSTIVISTTEINCSVEALTIESYNAYVENLHDVPCRLYSVPVDDRTVSLVAENRLFEVPVEDRTYIIKCA